MKQFILYTIFFIYLNVLHGQNHDNTWLLGQQTPYSTKLEFNIFPVNIDSAIRNLPMGSVGMTMSDSIGNLIFYTNGINIHNSQYQLMQNGDNINPGQVANMFQNYGYPSPNSMISIAHPIQNNKYYLFHQSISPASDAAGFGEYLYYTLIDMNANSGLGSVERKNQILNSDSIGRGQLQMVKHGNGQDWWLIEHLAWSNGFHIFLITGDTIIYAHKQYIGNVQSTAGAWTGQSGFSPDGSKYARYDVSNDLDIFDFDRCTGFFSNPIHLAIQDTFDIVPSASHGGVAISPNNQYLYVSSYHLIYQFDLLASNIIASKDTVAVFDGFVPGAFPSYPTVFNVLMLAPDNKIYGLCQNEKYLHVINNPDVGSVNCDVQQHSINLPYKNRLFLPNFPHYRTPALTGSPCDTLISTTTIKVKQEIWEVLLYPNPTSHELTVQSNLAFESSASIEIFNTLGQLIKTKLVTAETNNITVDASSLLDGIYIMRLKNGENTVTKSFVVSK